MPRGTDDGAPRCPAGLEPDSGSDYQALSPSVDLGIALSVFAMRSDRNLRGPRNTPPISPTEH